MCLAIPGKVLSINGIKALADFDGMRKEIVIALLPNIKVGQYVIVHAGYAIEEINEKAAIEAIQVWHEALDTDMVSKEDII
jgi:hydrogenase expression/formation protein HypC